MSCDSFESTVTSDPYTETPFDGSQATSVNARERSLFIMHGFE